MSIWGTEKPKISTPFVGGVTITTTHGSELVNYTNHGLVTGDRVNFTTSDTLPSPLTTAYYYVIYVSADTFKLARTQRLAYAGTNINLTDDGTGTHTMYRFHSTNLDYAKITKDEAVADLLFHDSAITGHRSYVDKGQHWEFEVLIHLYKKEGTAVTGCVQSTDPNYDSFTKASHGFTDDDPVTVSGTLPTGLSENTIYYINYLTTSTFELATYPDATSIDLANDGTTITVTPADHILYFEELYQRLHKEVFLWRHKDGYPFIQSGVTNRDSLSVGDYAQFYLEEITPVYVNYWGAKDALKMRFRSVDYIDTFWNAGAY